MDRIFSLKIKAKLTCCNNNNKMKKKNKSEKFTRKVKDKDKTITKTVILLFFPSELQCTVGVVCACKLNARLQVKEKYQKKLKKY